MEKLTSPHPTHTLELGPESSLTEVIQVRDKGDLDLGGSRGGGRNGWILDRFLKESQIFLVD